MELSTVNQMKTIVSPSMVMIDDDTLHKLQAILLTILDDITSFCDEEGIGYVLSGGSALGAVRHGGFIPWDDDIDIDMPRADYDRFIATFPQRFASKYSVQAPELTPEVGTAIARVRLRDTVMRMHDDCGLDECGIFIDVFPIENVYNNRVARGLHGFACMATGFLYTCRRFWRDRAFYLSFAEGNPDFARVVRTKALLGLPTAILPVGTWSKIVTRVYSLCKDEDSELVAVPAGRGHYWGEMCERDVFAKSREATFEGRTVRIPAEAEEYLSSYYGDWQRIPKPEEREHHAYLELDFGPYALEE
ncbi:MAG: LicD family protein [Coriobacteriales bacterium]|nr:LicD family protein [Coriobacteriales bacterium]